MRNDDPARSAPGYTKGPAQPGSRKDASGVTWEISLDSLGRPSVARDARDRSPSPGLDRAANDPRRLISRVPPSSLPGAAPPVAAVRRRPVLAPPHDGPLALVVIDEAHDAWPLQEALQGLGLRTRVRIGGLEALHEVQAEVPDLVLLAAWRPPVDSRVFVRTCRTLAPQILDRTIALQLHGREASDALLRDEGVRRFASSERLTEELILHVGALGLRTRAGVNDSLDGAFEQLVRRATLMPGECVAGRFVVEERIGAGATSSVYRVRDDLLGGTVALKLLEPTGDPRDADRFRRELQIGRRLVHPNLLRCYDVARHEGRLFFTMELVPGRTLRDVLDEGPMPPMAQCFDHLARLLDAVGTVHAAGVVHRDIKPGNVFVGDSCLRLGDFGAARLEGASLEISRTGEVIGTLGYLPPEVLLRDGTHTVAGDLFAMGVLAFELLTGRSPWPFRTLPELLCALDDGPAPSVRLFAVGVPDEAERIIAALLSRDPGGRPADAFAASRAFRRCALLLGWGQG